MNFLLDTHVVLWWWAEPERLSQAAREALQDPANTIVVSPVSAYETLYKHRLGKLQLPPAIIDDFGGEILEEGWQFIELSLRHATLAGSLESDHRDPFDRLLAAQAIAESIVMISADSAMDSFERLTRLW